MYRWFQDSVLDFTDETKKQKQKKYERSVQKGERRNNSYDIIAIIMDISAAQYLQQNLRRDAQHKKRLCRVVGGTWTYLILNRPVHVCVDC